MQRVARGGLGDLALLPVRFEPRAASLIEGLRAALSVAVLVALGTALGRPLLAVAALGALLTCLCDPGGPPRGRLAPLLSFAVLGALAASGFGLARAAGPAVALPLAALAIFAGGFARALGQAGLLTGNLLLVVVVIGLDRALSPAEAAMVAALFLAGALWAVLLTLVIWRLHPFGPARRAIAAVYRALARLTADLRAVARDPDAGEARWAEHARASRRPTRDAIEAARSILLGSLRARGPAGPRATELLIRLEAAEQGFGALIALSETLEADPPGPVRAAAATALRRLTPILHGFAEAIEAGRPTGLARLARALAAMERGIPDGAPGARLQPFLGAIAERLRGAMTVDASGAAAALDAASPVSAWRRGLGVARANFRWSSPSLRHALRAALAAIPALAFTMAHPTPYGHWLTITLVLTMQPSFGLTWPRALERIGGTVLGGLAAALLALTLHTPAAIAAALFPLTMLSLALRPVGLTLFMASLTPVIVLLVELGLPGTSEFTIAAMRALYTAAGGALAVLCSLVLWPGFGPARLVVELQAAIAAHARYAAAVLGGLATADQGPAAEAARREAGLASNMLEASLACVLLEPRASAKLDAALTVDAALRRMAGRLLALRLDPASAALGPEALGAWARWIAAGLDEARPVPPRPAQEADGPAAAGLRRIARQVELIRGAMARAGGSDR